MFTVYLLNFVDHAIKLLADNRKLCKTIKKGSNLTGAIFFSRLNLALNWRLKLLGHYEFLYSIEFLRSFPFHHQKCQAEQSEQKKMLETVTTRFARVHIYEFSLEMCVDKNQC